MSNTTQHDSRPGYRYRGGISGEVYGIHWSSPDELAALKPEEATEKNRWCVEESGYATDATGTFYANIGSADAARTLVRDGWQTGADRIEKMIGELGSSLEAVLPVAIKRIRCWSDEGDELEYDKLRDGEVDSCWRTSRRRKRAKIIPAVTIVVNWSQSAMKTPEQIFWNGAAAVAAADMLESAGYRVAIVAASVATHNAGTICESVELKDFDQPIRLDTLSALLAHAGVYRTIGFGGYAASDLTLDRGFGIPVNFSTKMTRSTFPPYADTAIIEARRCYTSAEAAATVKGILEAVADVAE